MRRRRDSDSGAWQPLKCTYTHTYINVYTVASVCVCACFIHGILVFDNNLSKMYDIAGFLFPSPSPTPYANSLATRMYFRIWHLVPTSSCSPPPTPETHSQCIEIIRYYKSYRLMEQRIMLSISYHIKEPFLFLFCAELKCALSSENICDLVARYNTLFLLLLLPPRPLFHSARDKVASNLANCLS